MAGRYRPRREFKFWLYLDKPEESRLLEFIEYCKQTRKWARVVRDGIRLMWSLGEGDTKVLFELFPWIGEAIRANMSPPPNNGDLERVINNAVQASVKQAMMNMPSLPAGHMVAAPPQKISSLQKTLALPLIDDDDQDTIVLNKSANTNTIDNFFASFAKLGS